jgi:hypothetical protein
VELRRAAPVPDKYHGLLSLLAQKLAVLHFFKQLLFGLGARKKHAHAAAKAASAAAQK